MAALEGLHLEDMKGYTSVYDFPESDHQLIERLLCSDSQPNNSAQLMANIRLLYSSTL